MPPPPSLLDLSPPPPLPFPNLQPALHAAGNDGVLSVVNTHAGVIETKDRTPNLAPPPFPEMQPALHATGSDGVPFVISSADKHSLGRVRLWVRAGMEDVEEKVKGGYPLAEHVAARAAC